MKIINVLTLVLFVFTVSSCGKHKKADELTESRLDSIELEFKNKKFVYIDVDSSLHSELDCRYFSSIRREDKIDFGVKRINKVDITLSALKKCCCRCIDDNKYESLYQIAYCNDNGSLPSDTSRIKDENGKSRASVQIMVPTKKIEGF